MSAPTELLWRRTGWYALNVALATYVVLLPVVAFGLFLAPPELGLPLVALAAVAAVCVGIRLRRAGLEACGPDVTVRRVTGDLRFDLATVRVTGTDNTHFVAGSPRVPTIADRDERVKLTVLVARDPRRGVSAADVGRRFDELRGRAHHG